ncbi:MAG TPA: hypothetical protein PLP73_04000, partial [Candidatus Absconditabacterales bacterium]|nr:hypothetical protein [Candidatus Absconditabacterales bacterium]
MNLQSQYQKSDTNLLMALNQLETDYLGQVNKVYNYTFDYMKQMMSMYNTELDNSMKLDQYNMQRQKEFASMYSTNPGMASALYPEFAGQVQENIGVQEFQGIDLSKDLRSLQAQYPGQAWAKNNNPTGIKASISARTKQLMVDAGVQRTTGTKPPSSESGTYMSFPTIAEGMKAYKVLLTKASYDDIYSRLKQWVGTAEGDSYARTLMNQSGIKIGTKFSDLSEQQLDRLMLNQIRKESPGLHKLLTDGSSFTKATTPKTIPQPIRNPKTGEIVGMREIPNPALDEKQVQSTNFDPNLSMYYTDKNITKDELKLMGKTPTQFGAEKQAYFEYLKSQAPKGVNFSPSTYSDLNSKGYIEVTRGVPYPGALYSSDGVVSAKLKDLGETESKQLMSFKMAKDNLQQISTLMEEMDRKGKTGILKDWYAKNYGTIYDTDYQVLEAFINQAVPGLARGVFGEVGVLTDADVDRYKKALGSPGMTTTARRKVLSELTSKINKGLDNAIDVGIKSNKNVEGYLDLSSKYNQTMLGKPQLQ